MLLEETFAVLSLGKLCGDHGFLTTGPAVKNHISPKLVRKSNVIYRTKYHSLSLVYLSTSSSTSSTPTSSTSSSQDSLIGPENPATERSGSMSGELRGNPLQKPAETETTKKYEVNYCMICRTGYRSSERICLKVFLQSHGKPVAWA